MKIIVFLLSIAWVSHSFGWGAIGHRTTALIAESYLTPQAKAAVTSMLNGQRLVDVVTWADSVRAQTEWHHTAPYHFQNIANIHEEVGLNMVIGATADAGTPQPGVLEAILTSEKLLQSSATSASDKQTALKFLIHFIGDLHQPLHTGRKQDFGGNAIALTWNGKETNLHRLWDSDIISERIAELSPAEGMDPAVVYGRYLVSQFDSKDVPAERLNNVSIWYQESLAVQTQAYDETYKADPSAYYVKAKPAIDARVYLAGRRMADTLNKILINNQIDAPNMQLMQLLEKAFGALEDLVRLRAEK